MEFAVIGGTGRIGSQVVRILNREGHTATPHARSEGVDLLTGKGLNEAMAGADVAINLINSPTFDDASHTFFRSTMDNMLAAAQRSGVRHAVILSIVGVDRVPGLDYYRAKVLQEDVLKAGPIPYSIVRATQFFEFMDAVLDWTADADTVRLPTTRLQPVAAAEVAQVVADTAAGPPLNGTRDLAGPDVIHLDEIGRITLAARGDARTVITDDTAGMFAAVAGDAIIAGNSAEIGRAHYRDWLTT